MKTYQKKIILFPAGASGNFLASFLTTGDIYTKAQYRIDLGQFHPSAIFAPPNLEKLKNIIVTDNNQTVLSHYNNISDIREFENQHWLRKIYPHTNIFGWLKNVFYKKQNIEFVKFTQADRVVQFDAIFENMKDFYFKLKEDTDCPADLTIDFGSITDISYLVELYIEANASAPDKEKIAFAQSYIDMQNKPINDVDSLDMEDLARLINPQDLYEVATLLFIYEKNHKTLDQNRLWTIDDLPTDINHAVDFLIKNSKKYSIFKETRC
jgi:hypothetical protein